MIPLTKFDILNEFGHIPYFRGISSRYNLLSKTKKKECGVINYDCMGSSGTHWTCYFNDPKYSFVEFYDPFGIQPSSFSNINGRRTRKEIICLS